MCAWKRGTQNNSAGAIRKGHIREFLEPSSKSQSAVGKLNILLLQNSPLKHEYDEVNFALVCDIEHGLPNVFHKYLVNNSMYIHSHKHPRCVLLAVCNPNVPAGCIIMSEIQCLNSKVCVGEHEDWTVYQGDHFQYDAREGVIGDTDLRIADQVPQLHDVTVCVRPRFPTYNDDGTPRVHTVDANVISHKIAKLLFGCIVSVDELLKITLEDNCSIICRINEVAAHEDEVLNEEDDFVIEDCHRGTFEADTVIIYNISQYCR